MNVLLFLYIYKNIYIDATNWVPTPLTSHSRTSQGLLQAQFLQIQGPNHVQIQKAKCRIFTNLKL